MLEIQKAVKEQIELRAAITGPTGGGKTYTGLRLAFALSSKVLVIDTERKSARKYAGEKPDGTPWEYDVIELPNFSPSTYTEAIKLGTKAGYGVILIDSMSHAWDGEGGILELQQKYGGRYQDWAKVNPLHFGLIDAILTAPCHMIVTMRSKMDYAIDTIEDGNGKTKTHVTKLGLAPIQRNGVQYEFDFILDMDEDNVGRVNKTRCSTMRGKVAAMPGPGFFQPLIDWLNSGPEPEPKTQTTPVDVPPARTNGNPPNDQPAGQAKPYKFPSTAAEKFFDEVQAATGNYYTNAFHLVAAIGGSWFDFSNADLRAEKLSVASDHARQAKEPIAA